MLLKSGSTTGGCCTSAEADAYEGESDAEAVIVKAG